MVNTYDPISDADRHMNPPTPDYDLMSTDDVIDELVLDVEWRKGTVPHRSLALYHILLDMIGEDALVEELGYAIDEYPEELKELAVERGVAK